MTGAQEKVKRALDVLVAGVALVATAPLAAIAAIGITLSSRGPIFYRAERMGRGGKPFRMLKFRTMHMRATAGSEITAPSDSRVFPFAKFLRLTKIDELPQFWNVLVGDMSVVGPRPESVSIVRDHYRGWMTETLSVRPGITSPGSIFGYTHAERLLDAGDPEGSYVARVLAPKLAIERAYIERAGLLSDAGVMLRTAGVIVTVAGGRRTFPLPREARTAARWHDFGTAPRALRILFTHRYFWPDTPPYGAMLRSLSADMVRRGHHVALFAGRPSYGANAVAAPARETIDGVAVRRIATFREDKSKPLVRSLNVAIYCTRLFFHVLRSDADVVTAASFPPIAAAWTASLAAKLSGKRFIYHLQDVHPEVSVVSGGVLGRQPLLGIAHFFDRQTLRRAMAAVPLSTDMARTLRMRPKPIDAARIRVINNFQVDSFETFADPIEPALLARDGRVRAIFAGNLGAFQNLDVFVEAARLLAADTPAIELLFLGNGAAEAGLKARAADLPNVRFHDFIPYGQARQLIADADVGLVSLNPGVIGVSYPSKTFTYLGLGVPVAALVERGSDLATLLRENGLGFVATGATAEAVADMVRIIVRGRAALPAMRTHVAEFHHTHLSREAAFDAWHALFSEVAIADAA